MPEVPTDPREYLPGGPPQHRQAGIVAAFLDPAAARAAAGALEVAGYSVSQEEVNPHPRDRRDLREDRPGYPRTLIEEPSVERDARVTAGPSDPVPRGRQSRTVTTLTVAIDGDRYERARSIIEEHGGSLDAP